MHDRGWHSGRTTFDLLPIGALFTTHIHNVYDVKQKISDERYVSERGTTGLIRAERQSTYFVTQVEWLGPDSMPAFARELVDRSGLAVVGCAT